MLLLSDSYKFRIYHINALLVPATGAAKATTWMERCTASILHATNVSCRANRFAPPGGRREPCRTVRVRRRSARKVVSESTRPAVNVGRPVSSNPVGRSSVRTAMRRKNTLLGYSLQMELLEGEPLPTRLSCALLSLFTLTVCSTVLLALDATQTPDYLPKKRIS